MSGVRFVKQLARITVIKIGFKRSLPLFDVDAVGNLIEKILLRRSLLLIAKENLLSNPIVSPYKFTPAQAKMFKRQFLHWPNLLNF